MKTVGERIRDLREGKNYTQADVAKLLGTTQQLYSNYELGKCELPLRHLIRLADYYEVSTDYLVGRVSYPKPMPEFSSPFIQQITLGDFVCRIASFKARARRALVEYVNYLTYLESKKSSKELNGED